MSTNDKFNNAMRSVSLTGLGAIVNDPLSWAEAMLIHPETDKPFKANTVQRSILTSPHNRNAIRVHRRAGKTQALAVIILHAMATKKNTLVLCVSPMEIHVGEVYDLLLKYIEANQWLSTCVTVRHKDPFTIKLSNGARFLGLTLASGSSSHGKGLKARGQAADLVILDEADFLGEEHWVALRPIMRGDIQRANKVRVFAATTPNYVKGDFYDFCFDKKYTDINSGTYWHQIYCSVLDNPDLSAEYIKSCRDECSNELEWIREWLAQWPDLTAGVFSKDLLDKSLENFLYEAQLSQTAAINSIYNSRPPSRAIGVDWDKVNRDGHGPNIAVVECVSEEIKRVIYRVEIPQSEFSLDEGVKKVIELNSIFQPECIFVDRGLGEYQIEELKKHGIANPDSGLYTKVFGIAFNQSVVTPMPGSKPEKKPFKHAMINILRAWFERGQLKLSSADTELYEQFNNYHIVSTTSRGVKYNSDNEHGIDAVGLACMAIHLKISNPYIPTTSNALVHLSKEYLNQLRGTAESNQTLGDVQRIWKNKQSRVNFMTTDAEAVNERPSVFSRGIFSPTEPVKRAIF